MADERYTFHADGNVFFTSQFIGRATSELFRLPCLPIEDTDQHVHPCNLTSLRCPHGEDKDSWSAQKTQRKLSGISDA